MANLVRLGASRGGLFLRRQVRSALGSNLLYTTRTEVATRVNPRYRRR